MSNLPQNSSRLFTELEARSAVVHVVLHVFQEPLGIKMRRPREVRLRSDATDEYEKAIKDYVARDNPKKVQLVICIFPTARADRYSMVKRVLTTERPVPSQCVVTKNLQDRRKFVSVCSKVVQQINVKLGGSLWRLKIPEQAADSMVMFVSFHSL